MAPDTPTTSPRAPLPRRPLIRHDSSPILLPRRSRLSPGTQEPLKPRRSLQTMVKRVSMPSSSSPESVPEGQPTDSIGTTTTEVPSSSARSVSRRQSLSMMTLKALGWNTQSFYQSELHSANYDTVMKQFQLRKLPQEHAETSSDEPVPPTIMANGSLKSALELESSSLGVPGVVTVPSRRFSSGLSSGLPSGRQFGLRQPILPNSHTDHFHSVLIVVVFHTQVFVLPFQLAYGDVIPAGIVVTIEVLLLLEFLLTCNTAAEDKSSHRLVISRRVLFKQYARSWLVVDLFSSIPIQTIRMVIYQTTVAPSTLKLVTRTFRVAVAALRVGHLYVNIRKRFQRHEKEYEKGFLAWLWYSRYSHLLAIGKLLWLVIAIVHYLACLRHGIIDNHTNSASATDIHESSFWSQYFFDMFNAICLLQGQGDGSQTESIIANLFSILTVLLGSVLLAIVFGNVAVLVANFNANYTNYQRKLEAVVATMDKLQLPEPLRRRIHEYYTHLWSHYESLDGDISGFSKELSHTLALEVGLCRYMNLIVDVPFWKDCSPDFVTQIVLQLDVRVYLPDDFVFRQGEVGNELFMINHGTCDVYHGENTLNYRPESSKIHSTTTNDAVKPAKSCVRMQTGAVLGEMSLLMNYRRTANVLAVTHVEMCILKRETFQQLIARYPEDRRVVLQRILQWSIERNDKPFPWQELCEIMGVDPDPLTPAETASALLRHIECDTIDPSIQYGFQDHTTKRTRYHSPPQQPQDGYGPANESIRCQVEELQRGQSAVILMIQELAANVRRLENQLNEIFMAGSSSISRSSPPSSANDSQKSSSRHRKVAPQRSIRLLPLRTRVHATTSHGSNGRKELTRNINNQTLPLSTLLWTHNAPEHATNTVPVRPHVLHRRQSLLPSLP